MHDLFIASLLAVAMEGFLYALAPEKIQQAMRVAARMKPEVLRMGGMIVSIIAVVILVLVRR